MSQEEKQSTQEQETQVIPSTQESSTSTEQSQSESQTEQSEAAALPELSPEEQQAANEAGLDKSKEGERVSVDEGSLEPTFDDFEALKNGGVPFASKKDKEGNIDPKKIEAKPGASKQEVKEGAENNIETQEPETVAAKPASKTTPQGATARDYTGFSDEEKKLLSRTSNETFNYLRPQLLEKKKLGEVLAAKDKEIAALKSGKQLLPDNYYEHPQGYVLTPEYNQASQYANLAQGVHEHWKQQLSSIRKGDKWTDLDFDNNGKAVFTPNKDATPEAEANVLSLITTSANQLQTFKGKLQQVQHEFSGRHNDEVKAIKDAEKQYFGAFDDEKHPYTPVYKNILSNIPPAFRNSPLATLAAKASAANVMLSQLVKKFQTEEVNYKNKIAELEKKVGPQGSRATMPTNNDMVAGGSRSNGTGKNTSEAGTKFADFEALKH